MDSTTDEESGGGNSASPSGKTYKCQLCGHQLMSMGELKTHLNKNHKGTDNCYPCTECTSIFKRRDHLGRHMMTQHQINSQRVSCPFKDCDTVMTRKDHLRRHISQVHKVDPSEYLPSIKRRSSTTTTTSQTNSLNDSTSTTNPSSSGSPGDHTTKFKCVFTGCDAELSRKDHLCRHIKNVHKADPRDVIGHLYKTPRPEGTSSTSTTPTKSPTKSSRKRRKSGGDDGGGGGSSSTRRKNREVPSIPSSSTSGGGATLDLHLPMPPHPPGGSQGSGHPSTLSDYDYGAEYSLDDFGDQQDDDDEHLPQDLQIIDDDPDAALCIFCCYSFYPDPEDEDDKLEASFEFNKFFSEVLLFTRGDEGDGGGFRVGDFFAGSNSLFSVCSDCWVLVIKAIGRRLEVEEAEVGMGMRDLNIDKLRRSLGKYVEGMERIEGVIIGANEGHLEGFLRGNGRGREGKRQISMAMMLRDAILEMTNELQNWRKEMENRLIEKMPLSMSSPESEQMEKRRKQDKLGDKVLEVPDHEMPTQVVLELSSEEEIELDDQDNNLEVDEEEDDNSDEVDDDDSEVEEVTPAVLPPEEPEYGGISYECPFEDCYVRLVTKNGFFKHINTVHSHEPDKIRQEITDTLKIHGLIRLGQGETGTALQKKRYKQTVRVLNDLSTIFEGVDTANWSTFKRDILLDCRKRRLRCASLLASYSPNDIRDPRLNYPIYYDPLNDLFRVKDIGIIVNEGQRILGCGQPNCNFWTSCPSPPPSNPPMPISSTKIGRKSKEIETHIQLVHYLIYQCPFCPTALSTFRTYVIHLNSHPDRLACNYCHKPYFDRNELKRHKWKQHLTQDEIQACLDAGEKDPRILPKENDVYRCATCGNSYATGIALKFHEDEVHSENGKKGSWICGDCDKEFSTKGRLVYHQLIKCEERLGGGGVAMGEDGRWECEVCGSSLKSKGSLGRHLKVVHCKEAVEREWICEICGGGYTSKDGLAKHLKNHSEERPFPCRKGCGARYKRRSHAERHEKICKGYFRGKCVPHKQMETVEGVKPGGCRRFDKFY